MKYKNLKEKAIVVKELYDKLNQKLNQRKWTYREYSEGLVGDIGDLFKLLMVRENYRAAEGDVDEQTEHELADCLWSLIVIANELEIDLESTFSEQMDKLKVRVEKKLEE